LSQSQLLRQSHKQPVSLIKAMSGRFCIAFVLHLQRYWNICSGILIFMVMRRLLKRLGLGSDSSPRKYALDVSLHPMLESLAEQE
jgi:hypothetical protein